MKFIPHAILFAAFVATVVAANEAIDRWGVVPIGFGLEAPAGVYFAGLAFGLRDALHEVGGRRIVIAAIVVGTVVSYLNGDGVTIPGGHVSIAVASGAAFLVAESADLAVYDPLRRRQWTAAVVASNVVGSVIDSLLFLWLAFGATAGWFDLTVGKVWMIAPAILVVWGVRRRTEAAG